MIGVVTLVIVAIIFILNKGKLIPSNSKLKVEKENLQREFEKKISDNDAEDEQIVPQERIDAIRASFRKKIEIKPVKQVTKEDVEEFYKSQMLDEERKDNG